jgi:hypothetical protein
VRRRWTEGRAASLPPLTDRRRACRDALPALELAGSGLAHTFHAVAQLVVSAHLLGGV